MRISPALLLALLVHWLTPSQQLRSLRSVPLRSAAPQRLASTQQQVDPHESFSPLEKLLFARFADSVYTEIRIGSSSSSGSARAASSRPRNYSELIAMINAMTAANPRPVVHAKAKSMLVRLFPSWLLPQYRWMFAAPFPRFSAWMNAWVTKFATRWLMGPSEVQDLQLDTGGPPLRQQLLVIEKCRFLEQAGCMQTCLHACKVPTQDFFWQEMGLPVAIRPNATDFSCRFEFGVAPAPPEEDPAFGLPCLQQCARAAACGELK